MEDIISPPRLGFSPEGKELHDLDIRSAYTTALAFIGVPDWNGARHCVELDQLAVIDEAMTAALVEFRFPDRTRISVPAGQGVEQQGAGLSARRSVVVHRTGNGRGQNKGASHQGDGRISRRLGSRARSGCSRTSRDGSARSGREAKAMEPPDLVLDRLVKEIGNFDLRQGRASRRRHADHQGRHRAAPRVQHDVRRDRPAGPERDHQCTDGGVLHRPGQGIADRRRCHDCQQGCGSGRQPRTAC